MQGKQSVSQGGWNASCCCVCVLGFWCSSSLLFPYLVVQMSAKLESPAAQLQLSLVSDVGHIRCYRQANVTASRKVVLPLVCDVVDQVAREEEEAAIVDVTQLPAKSVDSAFNHVPHHHADSSIPRHEVPSPKGNERFITCGSSGYERREAGVGAVGAGVKAGSGSTRYAGAADAGRRNEGESRREWTMQCPPCFPFS